MAIPNVLGTMLSHLDPGFDAAFDELFPRAYRLAYRLLGQVEAAEDVAAEALARALARWSKIVDLEYREAWVLRVTTNLAIDILRKRPLQAADLVWPDTSGREAERDVDLRLILAPALRSLPRRQRQAIVLRYLADLPADEVARVLRISHGSVKVHVHRGLQALRLALGPTFGEVHRLVADAPAS
jgi:RNA polymerase sigma-70 factor, ECF subfamily